MGPAFQPSSGLGLSSEPPVPDCFPFSYGGKDAHLLVIMGVLLRFTGYKMK